MSRPGVPAYEARRWLGRHGRHCVIIPVINEGERIASLLRRMAALGVTQAYDVIICDGGSKDGSLSDALLEETGVRALLVKTGPGKLSAQLRCGYAFALEQGYEGVITIDGNNKDDPDPIPTFAAKLEEGYDLIQASRFIPGGVEENTPWKRRLAIRLIHAPALSLASGFHWTDTTQGFRGYSRRMLEDPRVDIFRDVFATYELLAYLNYRAPRLGYRCLELPTARRYPADEPPPTKIAPFKGEIELLATLYRTCTGGYNPN